MYPNLICLFRNQDLCFLACHTVITHLKTVPQDVVIVFHRCLDATIHIQFLRQLSLVHQEDPHPCQICFHSMISDHYSHQCHEQE